MACRIASEPISRPSTNEAQAARSIARIEVKSRSCVTAGVGNTASGGRCTTSGVTDAADGVMTAGVAGLVGVRLGMSEEYTIYSTAASFPRLTGRDLAGVGHPLPTLAQPCDFLRSGT